MHGFTREEVCGGEKISTVDNTKVVFITWFKGDQSDRARSRGKYALCSDVLPTLSPNVT